MANAGAGRIVLSSRSQPSQKALETIDSSARSGLT
ncbi:polyketide synthase pks5 [Mycobacterium tuberculosis]|uniref:Polyketide synthase pks5 n=1 Tax=Mycobacterium tuberculosis TaxID=1773 RepID=A0A0U0SM75_MYCTX|nr:polyketide synthase pks5 [Mycobacterium tuberculosis]